MGNGAKGNICKTKSKVLIRSKVVDQRGSEVGGRLPLGMGTSLVINDLRSNFTVSFDFVYDEM